MKTKFLNAAIRGFRLAAFVSTLLLFAVTSSAQRGEEAAGYEEIDLSMWVMESSKWGDTAFRNDQLFMRAKWVDEWFYVLVAPEEYTTSGRRTRVTLRNVRGQRTKLGYGLVFHSNATPLEKDYVFLIDSIEQRYRVVRHTNGKERVVLKWTRSSAIRPGKRRNILEIRDKGDSVDLFINGRFVRSLSTPYAVRSGQPGLYTDDTPIAFRELILIDPLVTPRSVAGREVLTTPLTDARD